MRFRDREQAAYRLAAELVDVQGENPLVLAIPRGGVPMGRILAEALDGDLDVVLVKKLRSPDDPEVAIGSVSETGEVALGRGHRTASPEDLEREILRQRSLLASRRRLYTPGREPAEARDRVTIVVDDGIATGHTLAAALRHVRAQRPRELIAAVAAAPRSTLRTIQRLADRTVCLTSPPLFFAVSQVFDDFRQVPDHEVVEHLWAARESSRRRAGESAAREPSVASS